MLYYSITSNVDEYASLDVNKLYEKYSDLDQAERTNAVIRDMNAVLYGGSAQIYSTDLDGGSRKLLFEYEHMVIQCVAAAGNYLYAYITSAQPPEYTVESTENEGFSRSLPEKSPPSHCSERNKPRRPTRSAHRI